MTMFDTGLDPTGLGEPFTLTPLEFDVLWEHLDLGDMPLILKVPSPGQTNTERAQLVERAWQSLSAKGFGRQVNLDPRLAGLLRLVARPQRELDGRLWLGRSVRLLAAADEDAGVLAVQENDRLTFRAADGLGLPRHALSVLPAEKAGPGHSITLPTKDFERAAQAPTPPEFEAALRRRGVRDHDAKTLREMIGDVIRQGQFGGASRDKWGRRVRTPRVISFFDTEAGRYLQVRKEPRGGGEAWTTISPADHKRLLHHLTELHSEAAPS